MTCFICDSLINAVSLKLFSYWYMLVALVVPCLKEVFGIARYVLDSEIHWWSNYDFSFNCVFNFKLLFFQTSCSLECSLLLCALSGIWILIIGFISFWHLLSLCYAPQEWRAQPSEHICLFINTRFRKSLYPDVQIWIFFFRSIVGML